MAIYKLIANGAFGPLEIDAMSKAYEKTLIDLEIANRDDPITELIAKAIVNVVATGERDPNLIEQRAINALGIRKTELSYAPVGRLPFHCAFRKFHPGWIRIVRQNHRTIDSDVCNPARTGNVRRRPFQVAGPA